MNHVTSREQMAANSNYSPYNPDEHDPDRRLLRVITDTCKEFPELQFEVITIFVQNYIDTFPHLVQYVKDLYNFKENGE